MRSLAVALAVLLAARASASGDENYQALVAQEKGIQLFKEGRLAEAHDAFVEANRIAPDKANPYRWLGMTEARMGDCASAIAHFDAFVKRIPPTDGRVAEAITVRDRCRADLAPRLGTLSVDSDPSGAEVRLDNDTAARGTTPFTDAGIGAGSHVVSVRKPGFAPFTRTITVESGAATRLAATLEVAPTPPVPPAALRSVETPSLAAPIAAGVVALALAGAGLGLALPVYGEADACNHRCSADEAQSLKTKFGAGWGLAAAGGVAALVDVVLWARFARRQPRERSVWIAPGAGSVTVGGRF